MLEFLAGFDALGLGTLIGSLLFLGALVWVLVDNRSFEELNRSTMAAEGAEGARDGSGRSIPLDSVRPEPADRGGEPRRPGTRRRAA